MPKVNWTSAGEASKCGCCGGCPSLPAVCFEGVYASNWVDWIAPGFCDLMALGPDGVGAWEMVRGAAYTTEFMGYGLAALNYKSGYGLKDDMDDPIFGTYSVQTSASPDDPKVTITICKPTNNPPPNQCQC